MSDIAACFKRDSEHHIYCGSAVDDCGLSVYAFRVLFHLNRRANKETGIAECSVRSIAQTCCINKDTVVDAIRNLEDLQLIKGKRAEKRKTLYQLMPQESWKLPEKADIKKRKKGTSEAENLSPKTVQIEGETNAENGKLSANEGQICPVASDRLDQNCPLIGYVRKYKKENTVIQDNGANAPRPFSENGEEPETTEKREKEEQISFFDASSKLQGVRRTENVSNGNRAEQHPSFAATLQGEFPDMGEKRTATKKEIAKSVQAAMELLLRKTLEGWFDRDPQKDEWTDTDLRLLKRVAKRKGIKGEISVFAKRYTSKNEETMKYRRKSIHTCLKSWQQDLDKIRSDERQRKNVLPSRKL